MTVERTVRQFEIELRQESNAGGPYFFEVVGIPEALQQQINLDPLPQSEWFEIFPIQVGVKVDGSMDSLLPMNGFYWVSQAGVAFYPRYPLQEGQYYTATFDGKDWLSEPAEVGRKVTAEFYIPGREQTATQVSSIYPSSARLPENFLRFYLYFSGAMRRGEALNHIHLLDSSDSEIPAVFLDTVEELWNPTTTRLTILLDPGRVKKGLRAHQELGRALVVGETYRLVIDSAWLDAQGNRLESGFTKQFTVIPEVITPPNPEAWRVIPPQSETRAPLKIQFPEPLDHALLSTFIHIENDQGKRVPGEVKFLNQETVWQFTPIQSWSRGLYRLWVDSRLEDLAGNNVHGLFDRPIGERLHNSSLSKVSLAFHIDKTDPPLPPLEKGGVSKPLS